MWYFNCVCDAWYDWKEMFFYFTIWHNKKNILKWFPWSIGVYKLEVNRGFGARPMIKYLSSYTHAHALTLTLTHTDTHKSLQTNLWICSLCVAMKTQSVCCVHGFDPPTKLPLILKETQIIVEVFDQVVPMLLCLRWLSVSAFCVTAFNSLAMKWWVFSLEPWWMAVLVQSAVLGYFLHRSSHIAVKDVFNFLHRQCSVSFHLKKAP